VAIRYEWDEANRAANLEKQGLDFVDAWHVYEAEDATTVQVQRGKEPRTVTIAKVRLGRSQARHYAVVTIKRRGGVRVISFRRAHADEAARAME
jgi:uncharacterized DUF497 family protein